MKDVDECKISVYFCHSNNFVRIFSGLDTSYITGEDMLQDELFENVMYCNHRILEWDGDVFGKYRFSPTK